MNILISGANGNLAGAVIRNLLELLPDKSVLAVGTRNPGSAYTRQLAASGIDVRRLDFLDRDSVVRALEGIQKALFISTYEPNDVRIRQHRNAVDAAVEAGVRHVVYTSFINAVPGSAFEHNSQVHAPTEAMIRNSGLTYTFLRHNLYAEFLLADLKQTLATGRLIRGGGDMGISFIGRDDLGISAARVLADEGHENMTYTETGPEALTWAQAAALMSEAFGRKIQHVDVTPEQWYEHSRGMGFSEPLARASASNVRAVRNGEFSTVSGDYEKITGRRPRTVREVLRDNREKYLRMIA